MYVNDHERIFNITLRHKFKYKWTLIFCYSAFHSYRMVVNKEQNSYPKMRMKLKRPLTCSWGVLFTTVDNRHTSAWLCLVSKNRQVFLHRNIFETYPLLTVWYLSSFYQLLWNSKSQVRGIISNNDISVYKSRISCPRFQQFHVTTLTETVESWWNGESRNKRIIMFLFVH